MKNQTAEQKEISDAASKEIARMSDVEMLNLSIDAQMQLIDNLFVGSYPEGDAALEWKMLDLSQDKI